MKPVELKTFKNQDEGKRVEIILGNNLVLVETAVETINSDLRRLLQSVLQEGEREDKGNYELRRVSSNFPQSD